jgi:phosphotransferase system  glucose/maltose/N-acetylglucosamine-specific IIC component
MVDFTFKGLFMTTSKGIPDLANLPASTTMARPYYTYSILVQSVFLLFFLLYFALSIFRVAKKIKNNKFQDVVDHDETTNKNATERNGENDN